MSDNPNDGTFGLPLEYHPTATNPTADAAKLLPFTQYRRSQIGELRPYVQGESLDGVSISQPDKDGGSPRAGDMIARNPKNHADQWLVAAKYFADNFEPVNSRPQPAPGADAPNFAREADMLLPDDFPYSTDPNAPYTRGYRRQNLADEIAAALHRAYRLGLAARPRVEDAALDIWKKQYGAVLSDPALSEDEARTLLTKAYDLLERLAARPKIEDAFEVEVDLRRVKDITRLIIERDEAREKLAEREAELAQMQRERDGERETRERASDALMAKDEAIGVLIEIAGPQACQRAMDILDERRAARQQTTKEKT